MTIILAVPLLIMIVGLLMWVLLAGKASDAGRIMFAAGLLVALFQFASKVWHISG